MAQLQKDRGWAWMTVLGAGTCMFFVVGGFKTIGILFVEFRVAFGASAAMTAAMMGVTTCLMSMSAPPASVIGERYTYRTTVMIGGALGAIAMFLASFANSIYFVIFVFGTLTGVSYACMFAPSLVLLSLYFDKRRSLANGLAMAGASIGQLVIPQLLNLLLNEYNLMWTLVIYSAVSLNCVVAGALLRPVSFYETKKATPPAVESNSKDTGPQKVDTEAQCDEKGDSDRVESVDTITNTKPNGGPEIENENEIHPQEPPTCCQRFVQWVRRLYDWSLFTNLLFLTYVLGIMFGNVGYVNPFQLVPPHAEDLNISAKDSANLLSITGAFDLFGRVFGGWFADLGLVQRNNLMGVCVIITGCTLIVYTFFEGYWGLLVFCIVLGLIGGFYVSLMAVVCVDFVGPDKFAAAFGLTVLFMGLSNSATPMILGYIRDVTGSYRGALVFCGIFMVFGGLAFLSKPLASKLQDRRESKKRARKLSRALPETDTLVTPVEDGENKA